jgi:rare lipoprotein A (peptidoglycan hydrolase)
MGAAEFLGTKQKGVAKVKIEVVSVPSTLKNFTPSKRRVPLKPKYNIGYTASSFVTISKKSKFASIEIGTFLNRREAQNYLKKVRRYLPKAHISKYNGNYKILFSLVAKEISVKRKLQRLKQKGLITGYGICWSYD